MNNASWGIVGYRHFNDKAHFEMKLNEIIKERGMPTQIVSGGATGADTLAREWAAANKVPFVEHKPAAYTAHALLARNTLIVRDSDLVIAFLSKESRGTLDTIKKAMDANKPVSVINI